MDARSPRDGRAIEELGHYDPMVRNLEARTVLNVNRIRYWLSVGAQPSEKVQVLLNKHGVKKPAAGEPWALPETETVTETEIEIVTEMSPIDFDTTNATAGGMKDGERNVNAAGVLIPHGSISRPIMEITIMG